MPIETNRVVLQVAVKPQIEKIILMLAEAEKRSKSAMISTLIEEALEQRSKKQNNRT